MFFSYHQNNSGGSFIIDSRSAPYVIIEADSAVEANMIAENKGLYFNGCENGIDCDCCGDRWCPQYADAAGTAEPTIYGRPLAEASRVCVPKDAVLVRIFYKDGRVETSKGTEWKA